MSYQPHRVSSAAWRTSKRMTRQKKQGEQAEEWRDKRSRENRHKNDETKEAGRTSRRLTRQKKQGEPAEEWRDKRNRENKHENDEAEEAGRTGRRMTRQKKQGEQAGEWRGRRGRRRGGWGVLICPPRPPIFIFPLTVFSPGSDSMTGPRCRGPLVSQRRFTAATFPPQLFTAVWTHRHWYLAGFLPAGFYLSSPVALRVFPCPLPIPVCVWGAPPRFLNRLFLTRPFMGHWLLMSSVSVLTPSLLSQPEFISVVCGGSCR